jgi:glycyl-tRNA synthetase beta chain
VSFDLVYEIGTEEIPAGYLPPAAKQLREEFETFLAENRLAGVSVETHATPRRIVLFASGLPARQDDRRQEVTGPPWKAAFDADGNPTKAAIGFARGKGLRVEDLREVETARGPYAGATITVSGRPTIELLAAALSEITGRLTFPKTMKWGPSRFRFARPVRWLLALLGSDVVPLEIEGVKAGRLTYGHRILAKGPFEVTEASRYEAALEDGLVVLRAADRAERIVDLLRAAAREAGGSLVEDPRLVEEVSYLVEMPSAFVGEFDDEFLELPKPVIISAMRDHQRYFAVEGRDGRLLPRFLCVANSAPDSVERVMNGNQRVLRARLDDARFYWNEDLRTPLAERVPALAKVVWLEGFGSLRDKSERIGEIAAELASKSGAETVETVRRAALLSKTDLLTEMIKDGKEFTALQGVMGREYAKHSREPEAVGLAIEEHYLPRFAGDVLPTSEAGACLAIADRVDTLVGVWAAGMVPSGSKDPFGLRRGALGIIRILLDRRMNLSIEDLIRRATEPYGERIGNPDAIVRETSAFVRDRLAGHLVEEEGFEADIVAAVTRVAGGNAVDARARAEALSELRSSRREDFEALAAGFKRAKNILKKQRAGGGDPAPDLLVESAERDLHDAFSAVDARVAAAEAEHRYRDALPDLARLRSPIDAFFDSVLVMTDDEALRDNRLRLLGKIVDRIQGLADLSRISPAEEKSGPRGREESR